MTQIAQKGKGENYDASTDKRISCCKVEAVVNVDERGQMVLPKEVRDKANIRAGDKLALMGWEKDGKTWSISLIKAEELTEMIKDILEPVVKEIVE